MMIVGIDPGAKGAIAYVDNGVLIRVVDTPSKMVVVSGKERARVDEYGLATEISHMVGPFDEAYIENVGSHPRESGAAGFAFGLACGIVRGVLGARGIPYSLVTPQEWKRGMSCPTDKNGARARAIELFPEFAAQFKRVKDDGRAEASLIALYGYQQQMKGVV
jgi:crossover junction endodeoxyribonuclease RuvC